MKFKVSTELLVIIYYVFLAAAAFTAGYLLCDHNSLKMKSKNPVMAVAQDISGTVYIGVLHKSNEQDNVYYGRFTKLSTVVNKDSSNSTVKKGFNVVRAANVEEAATCSTKNTIRMNHDKASGT